MDAPSLRADRQPLTIEEVQAAGLPAILSAFGDHLAYVDGTVYALPRELDPCELADLPDLQRAYEVTHTVGIEYGWYQIDVCPPAARGQASQEAA